ncbi:IS66-like element accessory protein TnpA [Collimonas humicola]|uniref:IS66-like element accessory protein TnpA n=1 Tax=Collimonas humicola TaxID=2825886 RepID=UPI001B8C7617|nr:transposase [Collimonas humicola]
MAIEAGIGRKKKRPNYSLEFKKRLARSACAPGISVSQLALEHGINVNMLFRWRKKYEAELFDDQPERDAALLQVSMIDTPQVLAPYQEPCPASPAVVAEQSQGVIEIKFADAVVRVDGHADVATLRAVLQLLRP